LISREAQAQSVTPVNLDWPFFGNDLGNSRFQDVDQVNTTNAANLQVAWVFHTGVLDEKASLEVSPIVVNGTMFVIDGHDNVFALDAATGQEKWSYKPALDFSQLSICCGRASRGVAVGNGKVFLGQLDDLLVALNAGDGSVAWKATVVGFPRPLLDYDGAAVCCCCGRTAEPSDRGRLRRRVRGSRPSSGV
jgi:glucose dehydrogenase